MSLIMQTGNSNEALTEQDGLLNWSSVSQLGNGNYSVVNQGN
jgi:hypothetical protein